MPSRDACVWFDRSDAISQFQPAAKRESSHSAGFCSQLQASRRRHRQASYLADHRGEAGMAKSFLHGQQYAGIIARLDVNDLAARQAGRGKSGRKQIMPGQAP